MATWKMALLRASAVLFLGMYAQLGFSGTLSFSNGYMPRGPSPAYFNVTLTVTGLTSIPQTSSDPTTDLDNWLQLHVSEFDQTAVIKFKSSDQTPLPLLGYVVSGPTTGQDSGLSTFFITYQLQIKETIQPGYIGTKMVSNTIHVYADFNAGTTNTGSLAQPGYAVTQAVNIVNSQPSLAGVQGSMNSLHATWTAVTTVDYLPAASTATAPQSMDVYVFDPSQGAFSLPAKQFQNSPTTADTVAPDGACNYNPASNTGTCVTCGDSGDAQKPYYVDLSSVQAAITAGQLKGVTVVSATQSNGYADVGNLENDHVYQVALQYEPSGTKLSSCLNGKPSLNYTFTELNGEPNGSIVDLRCFIATAAYGSPMHHDLVYFRKFRDHILLSNYLGRRFVHYYYKYSPPLADFIATHPMLRDFTRGVLEVPAAVLKAADQYY